MKLKVGILAGGSSIEREVSLKSAEEIVKNLDREKYDAEMILVPKYKSNEWIQGLIKNPPDIILSGLHGGNGENGEVQGLLECLSIPYVGSKVLASSVGMNKHISKVLMNTYNIPVIDGVFIKKEENTGNFEARFNEMGFPLIVKPNRGGSSIGISIAENYSELLEKIRYVKEAVGDDVIVEKFVSGREVTCAVVREKDEIKVLSVLDITTQNQFYDYNAKYVDDVTEIYFSTLPNFLQTMIKEIAKKVFDALECKGYACVDMLVHEEQVYVIEINTLPGLTSHSLIPKAAKGAGLSFGEFLDRLIENELSEVRKWKN